MIRQFAHLIDPAVYQLLLVLFLSFLIGLEREEAKQGGKRIFGGVRTFPLLGLLGYMLGLLGHGQSLPLLGGLVVVAAFLLLSYWNKLQASQEAGITTEVSGLVVYLMGCLVYLGHIWFACALVVISLLLLELKDALEGLTLRIAPEEVTAFTKFLLLTAVILPMVPNAELGPFQINPFKAWLVVVAVSGMSYVSYVLLKVFRGRRGIYLSAVLGGIYSSTLTTVVLAKRASGGHSAHEISGSILTASGMMYLRIVLLVAIFNRTLALALAPSFLGLALTAVVGGWIWHRLPDGEETSELGTGPSSNPLELRAAFFFAALFLLMLVLTRLAVAYLGQGGIYTLAAIMGIADVDPFIMGVTHGAGAATTLRVAASGILIAAVSNNLMKGAYAFFFARNQAGKWSWFLLLGLAGLGLLPLFWIG